MAGLTVKGTQAKNRSRVRKLRLANKKRVKAAVKRNR